MPALVFCLAFRKAPGLDDVHTLWAMARGRLFGPGGPSQIVCIKAGDAV